MQTLKRSIFAAAILVFIGIVANAQDPVVTVTSKAVWHTDRVDNAYMNKRIEDAAEQYKEYAPIPRIGFWDIAYPKDGPELEQLNGYGLLLVSAMSQDQNELPVKRVYVLKDGKETELKVINRMLIKGAAAPRVSQTFGMYREDSIFLFPVFLNSDSAELRIDYARNRNGMLLAKFDGWLPDEIVGLRSRKPVDGKNMDAAVELFMKREYPGYFKN